MKKVLVIFGQSAHDAQRYFDPAKNEKSFIELLSTDADKVEVTTLRNERSYTYTLANTFDYLLKEFSTDLEMETYKEGVDDCDWSQSVICFTCINL